MNGKKCMPTKKWCYFESADNAARRAVTHGQLTNAAPDVRFISASIRELAVNAFKSNTPNIVAITTAQGVRTIVAVTSVVVTSD